MSIEITESQRSSENARRPYSHPGLMNQTEEQWQQPSASPDSKLASTFLRAVGRRQIPTPTQRDRRPDRRVAMIRRSIVDHLHQSDFDRQDIKLFSEGMSQNTTEKAQKRNTPLESVVFRDSVRMCSGKGAAAILISVSVKAPPLK